MKQTTNMKVGVISLGCDKNRVDTEVMLTKLKEAGYTFTNDPSNADIIIINTCAFIKSAREEAQSTISEMIDFKTQGKLKKLIVTGCYPQKSRSLLQVDFPEIDAFVGVNEYKDIVSIIDKTFKTGKDVVAVGDKDLPCYGVEDRVITTPKHYAYLKIADGCNNFCTYCTIPYIRGRYRSRTLDSLYKEAVSLVKNGAREIILVAQDVAKYGTDRYKEGKLVKLLQKLSTIEELKWIRLLYCYPEDISDELISEMINNKKVVKYIDMPLQHVSDEILKKMNRKTTNENIRKVINKLRANENKIAIRTTFMLGFPGETNKEFNELCNFVKESRLDYVGFFEFSPEEGTVAEKLDGQVKDIDKRRRLIKLAKIQKKVVKQNNRELVGKTFLFVYEGDSCGRIEIQAPDIDSITYIEETNIKLVRGKFYYVKITGYKGYDLIAKIISKGE